MYVCLHVHVYVYEYISMCLVENQFLQYFVLSI